MWSKLIARPKMSIQAWAATMREPHDEPYFVTLQWIMLACQCNINELFGVEELVEHVREVAKSNEHKLAESSNWLARGNERLEIDKKRFAAPERTDQLLSQLLTFDNCSIAASSTDDDWLFVYDWHEPLVRWLLADDELPLMACCWRLLMGTAHAFLAIRYLTFLWHRFMTLKCERRLIKIKLKKFFVWATRGRRRKKQKKIASDFPVARHKIFSSHFLFCSGNFLSIQSNHFASLQTELTLNIDKID